MYNIDPFNINSLTLKKSWLLVDWGVTSRIRVSSCWAPWVYHFANGRSASHHSSACAPKPMVNHTWEVVQLRGGRWCNQVTCCDPTTTLLTFGIKLSDQNLEFRWSRATIGSEFAHELCHTGDLFTRQIRMVLVVTNWTHWLWETISWSPQLPKRFVATIPHWLLSLLVV